MEKRRRIRVRLVAPTLRLMGGHAVQAARLIEGWRDDPEIEAQLIPINPPAPRALARLARIRFVRTLVTQLVYWPLLLRRLREADVVHVFATSNSSFFLAAMPAILLAHLFGKPVIVNYRGDSSDHLANSATVRRLLKSVSVNVVPSAYFHAIFRGLGIPAEVVANVADLGQFRYRVRDPIRPRLLSTRNFEPIYNVACTLRAFARVQADYPDASLVLVGAGTDERALRTLASDLRLRNVTFAGRVPHRDIHRFYEEADIYLQTPVVDNMPGSVVEAFASGLPVISTAVGGVPVIVGHGVHGLLAPADDDGEIARCVRTLLIDQEYARRLASAGFATCSGYRWSVIREEWRRIYKSIPYAHDPLPTSTPTRDREIAA